MSNIADLARPPEPAASKGLRSQGAIGVAFGLGAEFTWGFLPLYLKAVASVPAVEVLAHRVIWSLLLLAALVVAMRRWQPLVRLARDPRTLMLLGLTSLLIGVNWLIYIWAVNSGHVLETSLGYFINPLVNVALGVLVLRERLRKAQIGAVSLAALGVAILAIAQGSLPWISLALAFSFSLYGLIRKMAPADPLTGLLAETALLAPVALVYLAMIGGGSFAAGSLSIDLLLILSGVVTAAPLLMFAAAGKRLRYATLGLLQYIAPTIQFLLAVLLFKEELGTAHLVTFACIWIGLAIYAADAVRAARRAGRCAGGRPSRTEACAAGLESSRIRSASRASRRTSAASPGLRPARARPRRRRRSGGTIAAAARTSRRWSGPAAGSKGAVRMMVRNSPITGDGSSRGATDVKRAWSSASEPGAPVAP